MTAARVSVDRGPFYHQYAVMHTEFTMRNAEQGVLEEVIAQRTVLRPRAESFIQISKLTRPVLRHRVNNKSNLDGTNCIL
jgi:hypothetical protein